jgi:hypothetical protein
MLKSFRRERTPYDGPAFMVMGSLGYFMGKLDNCGLRPSRLGIVQDAEGYEQIHMASDDYLGAPQEGGVHDTSEHTLVLPVGSKIVYKGELEAGGILMLTPTL